MLFLLFINNLQSVSNVLTLLFKIVSPSIRNLNCKEAASKARLLLFMTRQSFAERPVPAFTPIYNTLVQLQDGVLAERNGQIQRVFVNCHI